MSRYCIIQGEPMGTERRRAHRAMSELSEKILDRDNMNAAYRRVCANKGADGIDDVAVEKTYANFFFGSSLPDMSASLRSLPQISRFPIGARSSAIPSLSQLSLTAWPIIPRWSKSMAVFIASKDSFPTSCLLPSPRYCSRAWMDPIT